MSAPAGGDLALTWTNLGAPATPLQLTVYCAPAFTVLGDGASTPAEQQGAYVLLLSIASVDPNAGPTNGTDTSFEALAKQVLRWTVAAAQPQPVLASSVDDLVVSDATLEQIVATLADPANPLPIAPSDVDTFLQRNAVVDMSVPSGAGSAAATYFPMPPQVQVSVPALGIGPYTIGAFNSYSLGYISYLQDYFSALDVQVSQEAGGGANSPTALEDVQLSVGSFVYADYFTLMARHLVGAARDALRDLKLPVPSGQSVQATVKAINLAGKLTGTAVFTVAQLFEANAAHPVTAGLTVQVGYPTATGDTLAGVAKRYASLSTPFTTAQLATSNQSLAGLLAAGTAVTYPNLAPHIVTAGQTLVSIAADLGVSVPDLIAHSSVAGAALATGIVLLLPAAHQSTPGDTLGAIAATFGVPVTALGDPVTGNAGLSGLFALGDTQALQYLDVPHLPQYRLGDLIEEAQQSLALQQLSGMVARYFLHGVRLPTDTTGTAEKGLFALTGQQLALGTAPLSGPFTIDLSCPDGVSWLQL
jgi:LysM repeat protein